MFASGRSVAALILATAMLTGAGTLTAEDFVQEPTKKIPVAYDVDVVVCGGGTSGTFAALAAARHGAKTLVIDRFGRLGGNMGPGMFAGGSLHFSLTDPNALVNRQGLGGVAQEFLRRVIFSRFNADRITPAERKELEARQMNVQGLRVGSGRLGYTVESHTVSYVAFKMMKEAGVRTLLAAYVSDPIMEGNKVRGVFVETKSGRLAVRAKVVVDATGDGDVAFRGGAPVEFRKPNCGVTFGVRDVDWPVYYKALKDNGRKITKWFSSKSFPKETDGFRYRKRVGKATIAIRCYGHERIVMDRTGTWGMAKTWDAKGISEMEREHRIHLYEFVKFMQKHAPGWKKAHLQIVAPYLGSRGGRSAVPRQSVTGKDVRAKRRFDDVIYIYCHDKGRTPAECDMPYRILLPKKITGLLLAGRSGLVYGPNFRQRHSVIQHGQAAGVAAALPARDGVEPHKLNVRKLQKALLKDGCALGEDDRLRELGLK